MKKSLSVATACMSAMFLLAGCAEKILPGEDPGKEPGKDPEQVEIQATTGAHEAGEGVLGRSTLNGNQVVWTKEDEFVLYDQTSFAKEVFTLTKGENTTSGTFSGYMPEGTSFVALYCYQANVAQSTITLPQEQRYVAGGFAPYINPMVATADDPAKGLEFQNLMGILELQITGTKTIEEIRVSGENQHLAGKFSYDYSEPSVFYDTDKGDKVYSEVRLTGINETLDQDTPKPFNIVLPPGQYGPLSVTIVNTDGTIVKRTTFDPIEIVRNRILPVQGLVDGEEDVQAPLVTIDLATEHERHTWYSPAIKTTPSAECAEYYFLLQTDAWVREWKANNPGATEQDMLKANASSQSNQGETIVVYNTLGANVLYHFYAFGIDSDGKEDAVVQHIEYSTAIPYDNTLAVEVSIPQESVEERQVKVSASLQGNVEKILLRCYDNGVLENPDNTNDIIFLNVVRMGFEKAAEGANPVEHIWDQLMPGTEYDMVCIGVSAEGKYSPMTTVHFKTAEHEASAASLTITPKDIRDLQASFSIGLENGATGYVADIYEKAAFEQMTDIADILGTYSPASEPVFTDYNIFQDQEYVLCAVAFDENGGYGDLQTYFFRSEALTEVSDADYNAMLGYWAVDYTEWFNGTPFTKAFRVTISPDIQGKTFLISGLQGANRYIQDDTILAYFREGKYLTLHGGSFPADPYPNEDLNIHLGILYKYGDQNRVNSNPRGLAYKAAINGDYIVFDTGNVGCAMVYMQNGGLHTLTDGMRDMVFHRLAESGPGASAPVFDKIPVSDPGWK